MQQTTKRDFRAALFDLDGVVLDTESQYSKFWGAMGRKFRPDVPDFAERIKGQTLQQIYDKWITDPKIQTDITQRLNDFEAHMDFPYIKGVSEYVQDLRRHGIATAIVTSSNLPKMENAFRVHPELLNLFDHILTAEDFSASKPDPDCYLQAAQLLGAQPQECVVYEDSVNGLKAGRASGAYVVGLTTTNPNRVVGPLCDRMMTDFTTEQAESIRITRKAVVDDKIPFIQGQIERLVDEVVYLPGNEISADDIKDANVLIVRTRTHCNRQLLEGSMVRLVVTATIGYDHLDTDYLQQAGIAWTNCPGCNAASVAQYIACSLQLLESETGMSLRQQTVGIVGVGHVGSAVLEKIGPTVGRVMLNDPPRYEQEKNANPLSSLVVHHAPLSTLMEECDIITLHVPLTDEGRYPTRHLVDDNFLHRLTRRPVIINAARGGVVDDEALERALDDGRIQAAVVDTWENEPHIRLSLLEKTFIGTPHIAGYSADGKGNATRMSLQAVAQWLGRNETFDITLPPAPATPYSPMTDSNRLKNNPTDFEYQRGHYPTRRE